MIDKNIILNKLAEVLDPELGVSIVDLGLIYGIEMKERSDVVVTMTLTTPGCPLAPFFEEEVRKKIKEVKGIGNIDVKMTFDPPWDLSKIKDKSLRQKFGF